MSSARPRSVVLATALTTSLALAAPAATAASGHHGSTLSRHRVRADVASLMRHQHQHHARIDAALLGKHGPVDVMLQLQPAPAVTPYAAVRAPRARLAQQRVAAFRHQLGDIRSAQRAVTLRLRESATRGRTLFTLHNLYDGVAVHTDASRISALANLPGVVAIHRLVPKHLSNAVTVPMIGAPTAWQGQGGVGADTGQGVKIGVIDTGIDYTHADFGGLGTTTAYDAAKATDTQAPQWTAKVVGGYDFAGDNYDAADPNSPGPQPDPNPLDCSGHGTHVAGTAAGFGVNADGTTFTGDYSTLAGLTPAQYQAQFKIGPGVAPRASLYALKIFGCAEESSTGSDLISAALDWAADPNGDGDPSDHLDVVNMSLGADFTTADDPDAVAANNASLAGVTVVAAAGNAGDEFNAAGAPGNAVRAISVAASDDTTDLVDGVQFSDVSGNQAAEESSAYDWAHGVTAGPGLTRSLATVGTATTVATWRTPSDKNNSDGCDPYSGTDAGKAAGNIVLLSWTDNDSARRCGSATRTDNAFKAGAVGVVLADDEDEFNAGILGTSDIPTVITTKTAGDQVAADVLAGHPATATLTVTLHNAVKNVHPNTANAVATFSSRGIGEPGLLKPDISAPGVTVFSALFGSGNDGTSNNGTSMATPHVTGSAALVKAVHPTWSPEQVKAALMNTAGQPVYARAADSSANQAAPEAPERSGAGRVEVAKAVADGVLAYATNAAGAVSVSFGTVTTAVVTTLSRAVTVQNTTAAPVTYTASYAAANSNPGATYRLSTSTCGAAASTVQVSVPAGGSAQLTVCLTVDPAQLTAHPDPTLTLNPTLASPYDVFNGLKRSFLSTASGRLVLTSQADGSTLRVPVYAAPRPASTMSQSTSVGFNSAGSALLPLSGQPVSGPNPSAPDSLVYSIADAFELQGANGAMPLCSGSATPPGCVPTPEDRAGDLADVGFASDGPLYTSSSLDPWAVDPAGDGSVFPALGYVGIATQGPWQTPDYGVYLVWFDINNDGTPDAVLYNTRIPGTDIFVAELASVDQNGIPMYVYDDELLNNTDGSVDTELFDSNVMTMPFTLAALKQIAIDDSVPGITPTQNPTRIGYFVDSGTIGAGLLDSIGDPLDGGRPMTIAPAAPGIVTSEYVACPPNAPQVGSCSFSTLLDDQPGTTLSVVKNASALTDRPFGVLLLHHDNLNGKRAQVVKFATVVSAPSPTIPYGDRYPLKVRVSSSLGTPPGTVSVYEGRTRLAAGTLRAGTVTLTLPARSLGRHTLSVRYSGDVSHAGSSRTITLTVTKASTRTTLAVSGTRSVTLTATTGVVSPGRAPVSGTVHFYDNGHYFASVHTTGRVSVFRRLTRGRHVLTAKYFGNSWTYASTGSRTVTV